MEGRERPGGKCGALVAERVREGRSGHCFRPGRQKKLKEIVTSRLLATSFSFTRRATRFHARHRSDAGGALPGAARSLCRKPAGKSEAAERAKRLHVCKEPHLIFFVAVGPLRPHLLLAAVGGMCYAHRHKDSAVAEGQGWWGAAATFLKAVGRATDRRSSRLSPAAALTCPSRPGRSSGRPGGCSHALHAQRG